MTEEQRLLRAILRLLIVIARWQFDSKGQDYRTRANWFGMRDGIAAAEQELGEP